VKEQFPPGTNPRDAADHLRGELAHKFSLQSDKVPLLDLRTLCDWDIRNRILAIPGIASVVCMGPGPKQYQVLLSSPKLLQYNVSVKEVVEHLRETNRNVPGGFNVVTGQEFVVTGVGRISSLDDLKKTVIAEREGVPIPLEQVAQVKFEAGVSSRDSAFMGKPAIIGTVSKLLAPIR
jgi:Cu/Ag efflux pump CusA